MPNEDASQSPVPTSESVEPAPELPSVTAPETKASAEPVAMPSEPITPAAPETQTAQMGRSEPFSPTPEPLPEQPMSQPDALAQVVAPVVNLGRDVLTKARATIQDRKRKKLEKILELLNTKSKIANDEVEKLLHVSDATATRYLSALEKEGKIQQVGKTGIGVVYTKI